MNSLKQYQNRFFRPKGRFLILAVAAIIAILAAPGCTPSAQDITNGRQTGTPAPEIGRLAPDFTLIDLEGNRVTLSDFRGKVVFINFWNQWCPPCRAEMPEIEAVYQEYKNKDVVVIGVDILPWEILKGYDESDVRQYVQQGGFSWTFVLDTTGEVTANYEVIAIPTSFFIDREGIIRAVNIGAMTKRAMEAKLTETIRRR
jgi:thiol-disulfide isomerase/thioredoxin